MPNVEIHGMTTEEGESLRRVIFDGFPDEDEMIIDIISGDDPRDRDGNKRPFLRLFNFCEDGTPDIIRRLRTLAEVEHVGLEGFYEKRP